MAHRSRPSQLAGYHLDLPLIRAARPKTIAIAVGVYLAQEVGCSTLIRIKKPNQSSHRWLHRVAGKDRKRRQWVNDE